jgi:hypothetical protein
MSHKPEVVEAYWEGRADALKDAVADLQNHNAQLLAQLALRDRIIAQFAASGATEAHTDSSCTDACLYCLKCWRLKGAFCCAQKQIGSRCERDPFVRFGPRSAR